MRLALRRCGDGVHGKFVKTHASAGDPAEGSLTQVPHVNR